MEDWPLRLSAHVTRGETRSAIRTNIATCTRAVAVHRDAMPARSVQPARSTGTPARSPEDVLARIAAPGSCDRGVVAALINHLSAGDLARTLRLHTSLRGDAAQRAMSWASITPVERVDAMATRIKLAKQVVNAVLGACTGLASAREKNGGARGAKETGTLQTTVRYLADCFRIPMATLRFCAVDAQELAGVALGYVGKLVALEMVRGCA